MPRHTFVALALLAAGIAAKQQTFTETFSEPGDPSEFPGVVGDNLPGPVNALYWENLRADEQIDLTFGDGPLRDVAAYEGYYYGGYLNSSEPAVLTANYKHSCVDSWTLESFAFGCDAEQNFVDPSTSTNETVPLASNCTVTVEGLDKHGNCVGRDVFHYTPWPLTHTIIDIDIGLMKLFNTTKGGLKGVKLETVKIGAKITHVHDGPFTYKGGLNAGIDSVTYTVFNKTKCA